VADLRTYVAYLLHYITLSGWIPFQPNKQQRQSTLPLSNRYNDLVISQKLARSVTMCQYEADDTSRKKYYLSYCTHPQK